MPLLFLVSFCPARCICAPLHLPIYSLKHLYSAPLMLLLRSVPKLQLTHKVIFYNLKSLSQSVYPSVHLFVCQCVSVCVGLPACPYVYVCLSLCLCLCLSLSLSTTVSSLSLYLS